MAVAGAKTLDINTLITFHTGLWKEAPLSRHFRSSRHISWPLSRPFLIA
jgi:hypothetical protein